MGSGTSNRGRLNMHDLVESEGVKLGHFGSPCHPALEARRGVAVLPEITHTVYEHRANTHARPAGAMHRTGGLAQLVRKSDSKQVTFS